MEFFKGLTCYKAVIGKSTKYFAGIFKFFYITALLCAYIQHVCVCVFVCVCVCVCVCMCVCVCVHQINIFENFKICVNGTSHIFFYLFDHLLTTFVLHVVLRRKGICHLE